MSEKINGASPSANENGQAVKTVDEQFEEIEIPVPWGHISGKWWGPKTQQPILAIHGWQDNAGTFDTLAPLLVNRGHALLCIDLPGHGLSSYLSEGHQYYLFWDGIHFIRRIVKQFNWADITIMGHSLGGIMGLLYSAAYPTEIKKFISIDVSGPTVRDAAKHLEKMGTSVDKLLKYESLTIHQMPCYSYEEMIDVVYDAYAGSVSRECCKIMMRRGMRPAEHKPGHFLFSRDPRLKVSALGFITIDQALLIASRVTCEVLNIRANPGMTFDCPEHYDAVQDAIGKQAKRLERHVVEGTHHVHLNDPESIVDIVDAFLDS